MCINSSISVARGNPKGQGGGGGPEAGGGVAQGAGCGPGDVSSGDRLDIKKNTEDKEQSCRGGLRKTRPLSHTQPPGPRPHLPQVFPHHPGPLDSPKLQRFMNKCTYHRDTLI